MPVAGRGNKVMTADIAASRRLAMPTTPMAAGLFAAVMLTAVVVLAGMLIWQHYRSALKAGEARAMSSAQVVAAHTQWKIEASDQALRRIDAALGENPVSASSSATIGDISVAVGDLPKGFQYSVYDENGRLRFSSVPEAIGIEVSDREYFRRLRNGETAVVSPQLKERLSGETVFVIARRVTRNGRFHGAASIAIPTKAMQEFWSLLGLGPNSSVSIVRTDGWLVARHPPMPETMELSHSALFTQFLPNASAGAFDSGKSPADGRSRIVGFQKMDGWPLAAVSGVAATEALSGFRANLRAGAIVGLPLIGLLVFGTFMIIRLLRADAHRRLALEHAVAQTDFLMREIHHRVKNNLQAVSSLFRLQPLPKDIKDNMGRRIRAMVAVHEQLYGAGKFDQVELSSYIEHLVGSISAGFRSDITVDLNLDRLIMSPDDAMPLGLIVNEVVTNAYKHAFTGRENGSLKVNLSVDGGTARLVIADDGPGYTEERKTGMGSKLIDAFVAQLGGTLEVDTSAGTRMTLSFPVKAPGA
jgi:two-component sensor histidine kinase